MMSPFVKVYSHRNQIKDNCFCYQLDRKSIIVVLWFVRIHVKGIVKILFLIPLMFKEIFIDD